MIDTWIMIEIAELVLTGFFLFHIYAEYHECINSKNNSFKRKRNVGNKIKIPHIV